MTVSQSRREDEIVNLSEREFREGGRREEGIEAKSERNRSVATNIPNNRKRNAAIVRRHNEEKKQARPRHRYVTMIEQ